MLLIRLTALGDVVLVEPAIRALRRAHPGIRVDLVTEARYAPFAEACLGADRVVPFDRRGADAGRAGVARVRERLGEVEYDAVVDLQGKLRTRALARAVPARARHVLRKRTPWQAALTVIGHDPPLVGRRAASLYVDALAPLGATATKAELELRLVRPAGGAEGDEGEGARRVGLNPTAAHATKRWRPERFGALAAGLCAHDPGLEILLLGGPSDAALLDQVRAHAPTARFCELDVGRLDVRALAETVAGLDLVVSVDSGPAHLAAGFGVPTIVLFGPTAPSRWGPVGAAHRALSLELDCAPCSNTGGARCPRPDRAQACLQDLEVAPVLEAAQAALARRSR